MHDHGPARNPDADQDLASFGFDGDAWLQTFREAEAPALGRLGEYDVLEEVGRGGQGVVYRARQPGMDRDVALKRLVSGRLATGAARERFDQEVVAASRLDHPNIVTVFARESVDEQPLLVMEWIAGQPFNAWAAAVPRGPRRPLRRIVEVFREVVDAVHHAHQRGIMHRDLKPSNILVDAADRPHLLDFGLAKALQDDGRAIGSAASTAHFVGTLAYAAPEQVANDREVLDIRADVYALGVVLYQALTGAMPYEVGDNLMAALQTITTMPPVRPTQRDPEIDADLEAILLKALAKSPGERYPSVDALGADLERYLAGEPVSAHPPSRWYAFNKFVRRNRMPVLAGVAAFIVVAGFAVAAARLAQRAQVARDNEARARVVAEQVSTFLGDVLSSARPSRGGAAMTMLEALDQAADRARRELGDQPRVAAEVYYRVGFTYRALWRFDDALPHLEEALRLSREIHDGDHEDVARCLAALGTVETSRRQPRAVTLQDEALAMRRRLVGERHLRVAESQTKLAYALHQSADPPRWDDAEALFEVAIAHYEELVGMEHRDAASCVHNLGWMRFRQQRFEEAMALYGQAIDILRGLGNLEDPYYAECMHGYSSLLLHYQRYDTALELVDEAIPLIDRIYGPPAVQPLRWRRALALQGLGRCDEARAAFVDAFIAAVEWLIEDRTEPDPDLIALRWRMQLQAHPAPGDVPWPAVVEVLAELPEDEQTPLRFGLSRWTLFLEACGDADEAAAVRERLGMLTGGPRS